MIICAVTCIEELIFIKPYKKLSFCSDIWPAHDSKDVSVNKYNCLWKKKNMARTSERRKYVTIKKQEARKFKVQ
jgi:hypothetical protein